jgi:hypothetical protein
MTQYMALMFKDDLSGEDADFSMTFGLDDQWYQIELTEASRNTLRDFLAGYAKAARPVSFGYQEIPARAPAEAIRQQQEDERIIEWFMSTGQRARRPSHVSVAMRKQYQNRNEND